MPQNLATFEAAKMLTLSAAGTATSAAAAGLSTQLNQSYSFFHLDLPLWFFYIAMVVLTFMGAFLSLTTDYMRNSSGTTFSKFTTAVMVALFISFVVLPALIDKPSPALMMITSFIGGLSGTLLLYITMRLLGNKELQDAVIDLISQHVLKLITSVVDTVTEHLTKLISALAITIIASFLILPKLNDKPHETVTQQSDTREVKND